MNALPFCLVNRADRNCYAVRFKDEHGKYLPPISTGKKDKGEAMQAAFQMLRDGIPEKTKKTGTVQGLALKETARKLKSAAEVQIMLNEFQRLGWLKSYVMKNTEGAEDLLAFLKRFWDWNESPYVKEKLRKEHGIHRRYCLGQSQNVALYWAPYFEGRLLGELTTKDLGGFIDHIGQRDLSASRKNVIIKAGTIPLRWAFAKGMIDHDPVRGQMMFSGATPKRHIPTPAKAAAVFNAPWKDEREMLGNLLASVTGMRCGEIQALRLQDLARDCIHVNWSWNFADGMKPTKNNEARIVEVNFPELMGALLELAKRNPWGVTPESYVFWSDHGPDTPFHGKRFLNSLRNALVYTGMTEAEAKKYVFHAWRHFYTSYMVKDLDSKLLMSQTGHKTKDVFDLYADHEIEGDRETIRLAQRRVFAGLLPQTLFAQKAEIAESAAVSA